MQPPTECRRSSSSTLERAAVRSVVKEKEAHMLKEDPIKPARGCLLGLALGIALWALVFTVYWIAR